MEISNKIRKLINDLFKSEEEDKNQVLSGLYERRKTDKDLIPLFEVVFHTAYVVNYYLAKKKSPEPDFEKQKEYKTLDDFINNVKYEEFYNYCDLVVYFEGLKTYQKKIFMNTSLDKKSDICKISKLYLDDINNMYERIPITIIKDKYNEHFSDSKCKEVATEDTICDITDYLIDLEDDDYEAYCNFFSDILYVYYYYNNYLIDNNLPTDEYAPDIIHELDRDQNGFISFSCSNEYALEPVIRDYINYMLLDPKTKAEVDKYNIRNNEFQIKNPNKTIRDILSSVFAQLNINDEDCIYEYQDELNTIKKDGTLFNTMLPVLYLDSFTYDYNRYLLSNNNNSEADIQFMKEFNNVNEFGQYLIENDYVFLNAIYKSLYFHKSYFLDKLKIITNLLDNNCYNYCLTDNYVFDLLMYNRKYTLKDINKIYDTEYFYDCDTEAATIRSSALLADDLLNVRKINQKNYVDLMKLICKNFYSYEKYKIVINDPSINSFDKKLLKLMDQNIDVFINSIADNDGAFIYLLQVFYEYNNLSFYEVNTIRSYVDENLNNNVVLKKLSDKNKKSYD